MDSLSRLESLFAKAMQLPADQRHAAVREWTADEPALGVELIALLHSAESAPEFLEDIWHGRQLGSWRIDRRIGMGGMGDVYLASRADGHFEMQAAVKLLGEGLASDALRERFLLERQILASLDHPFIARLFDGGIAPDGQPYLVMEWVDGTSLLDALAGKPLNDRLALFCDIAAAVQYAHQHLVVHADIKPSNVMVRHDGIVKLLDFGIAVVPGPSAAPGASARYSSPEQLKGERPTVSSDVYSLGMLLNEIIGKAPDELQAIVRKATTTLPADRYPTVEALLQDVLRYRQGRAVLAAGSSPAYRLKKYLRRHWLAASALAIILAFGGYAIEQRMRAEVHFLELKRAARIMVFDVYEGIQYLNPPPDVMEHIVESGEQVLAALMKTKNPDASLRFDVASAEERLAELLILSEGNRDRALQLLDRSLATTAGLLAESPQVGSYHRLMASGLQYRAQHHREQGHLDAAGKDLDQMEHHVRQALSLPEPKSRDWMYLSLIDLRRGQMQGPPQLRDAITRIARRETESPFRDARHQHLRLEGLLSLAAMPGTDTPSLMHEFEQLAGSMRAAGRLSGMAEMRLGLEAAGIYQHTQRAAALERARAAADLARPTQATSPAFHILDADLALATGDKPAARRSLERAMQLNQWHGGALRKLFNLRLEDPNACASLSELTAIARRFGEEQRVKALGCPL